MDLQTFRWTIGTFIVILLGAAYWGGRIASRLGSLEHRQIKIETKVDSLVELIQAQNVTMGVLGTTVDALGKTVAALNKTIEVWMVHND